MAAVFINTTADAGSKMSWDVRTQGDNYTDNNGTIVIIIYLRMFFLIGWNDAQLLRRGFLLFFFSFLLIHVDY